MVRHELVDNRVREFLNFAELPVKIVTGKSKTMRNIVVKVIKEYEYDCDYESSYNFGALIVRESTIR